MKPLPLPSQVFHKTPLPTPLSLPFSQCYHQPPNTGPLFPALISLTPLSLSPSHASLPTPIVESKGRVEFHGTLECIGGSVDERPVRYGCGRAKGPAVRTSGRGEADAGRRREDDPEQL